MVQPGMLTIVERAPVKPDKPGHAVSSTTGSKKSPPGPRTGVGRLSQIAGPVFGAWYDQRRHPADYGLSVRGAGESHRRRAPAAVAYDLLASACPWVMVHDRRATRDRRLLGV